MLRSYIPNMVQKSAWYRDSKLTFVHNISKVCATLMVKRYLVEWWRSRMVAKAATIGLQQEAILGIPLWAPSLHTFKQPDGDSTDT